MDFMVPEIRNQNSLVYLQICSRSQGQTPTQGPTQGS